MNKTKQKKLLYGGLDIGTINSIDELVPTTATLIDFPLDDRKALAIAIRDNLPALLLGETGTGKTSVIKHLAYLRKQPYVRVSMTGYTTPDELIGSKSVKNGNTFYENGIITDAMTRGALLVIDEVNATTPDCLFILHGLLDEDKRITLPDGNIITPHKDFRVFATGNPDYEGTKSMNKAFIDRFPIVLFIDVLSPIKEKALLSDRTNIAPDIADKLVTVATMARKEYADSRIFTFLSTRSLLYIAQLINAGLTPKSAYETTVTRKTNSKDEQKALLDFFLSVFKMAESTNTDNTPTVVTVGELNRLRESTNTAISKLNEAETNEQKLRIDSNEKLQIMKQYEQLRQHDKQLIDTLTTERTNLLKELETFKRLESIISEVAAKNLNKNNE